MSNYYLDEAKKAICDYLRDRRAVLGQKITGQDVLELRLEIRNSKVVNELSNAFEELENKGFFVNSAISQVGFGLMYGSDETCLDDAKEFIFDYFRDLRAQLGDVLPFSNLLAIRERLYNMKTYSLLGKALEQLCGDGILEKKNGIMEGWALTQEGFDSIF